MVSDRALLVVLLNANLLYPFHLRNLLIQFGVERLFAVRWTDANHEEWIGNLVADGRATRERLLRTLGIMRRVLPEADVFGYEHRIAGLDLPDAGDRPVLAAAIESGASILLTFNLADFPRARLVAHSVVGRDPDNFLCERPGGGRSCGRCGATQLETYGAGYDFASINASSSRKSLCS